MHASRIVRGSILLHKVRWMPRTIPRAALGVLLSMTFTFPASLVADEQLRPSTYQLEIVINRRPNPAETELLGRPRVMTLDRTTAALHIGQTGEVVTIEDKEVIEVEIGLYVSVTPYRLKDGGVKLDIEAEVVSLPQGMPDVDEITTKFGIRRILEVPLNKEVQIPLTPRGQFPAHLMTVTVREVEPPTRKEAAADGKEHDEREGEVIDELPMPQHETPFRTHGGIISFHGGL